MKKEIDNNSMWAAFRQELVLQGELQVVAAIDNALNNLGFTIEETSTIIPIPLKQGDKDEEILILKDKIESLHAAINAIKETHRIELEKQGEQKPAIEMKSAEESLGIDSETHNKIVDECIYGEQKPADKVESNKKFTPIESALKNLVCDVDNSYTIEQVRRFLFEYGYKDKIINAAQEEMLKPAWSEEDESHIETLIGILNERMSKSDEGTMVYNVYKNQQCWLKSLKDRVQLQPKQEWGEEDERKIYRIYSILGQAADTHAFSTSCRLIGDKECIELQDFLKSLRPQNRWKPSDEQIECLSDAIKHYNSLGYPASKLKELLDDLKKLRDE